MGWGQSLVTGLVLNSLFAVKPQDPVEQAVRAVVHGQRPGWQGAPTPFNPGIWNHASVSATGGSQILGTNRYRIYSPDGSYSSVQINNSLAGKSGKLFQFRITIESIAAGTSLVMGDDIGNDITITGVGTHTGTWVVNGPTATVKRLSGATDMVVKNIQLIEVNRSPVTAAAIALGNITVGTATPITAASVLAGVTDPDGDVLTIVGYAVHSGSATITGSGPYTLTPTGAGAGTASFTISDGRGGVVTRGVTWTGVATVTNQDPLAPVLALGDIEVGTGLVVSTAELLAGATDPDGDTLTITSVTAVSGGTVTGTGPWTITPTATGAGSATVTISDGRGGSVTRTVTWSGYTPVAVSAYARKDDYQGLFRDRTPNTSSYLVLPAVPYVQTADLMEWEYGFLIYSDEAYTGNVQDTRVSRGTPSATRNALIKRIDGSVQYRTDNNVTLTIGPPGTWNLGEFCRLRVVNHPANGIILEKMDSEGVYQHVQTTPRGTATVFLPTQLMGNSTSGVHGTCFYSSCKKNGETQYDFRMDEMVGGTLYSAHDQAVTATYVEGMGGKLVWRDETPESLAPQPDITITGTLAHGATMTMSSSTLTFPGGMPQAYLYDDMSGRSGQVGTAVTLGTPFTQVKNASAGQTYKAGGPGGRPYLVRWDGPTSERVSRVWSPGFAFSELFSSRQVRIPEYWPGSHDNEVPWTPTSRYIPDDSTWKDVWGLTVDDGGNSGSDIILGSHVAADHYKHGGNSTTKGGYNAPGTFALKNVWQWNEWTHQQNYARFNPADPQNGLHVMTLTNSRANTIQSVSQGAVLCADRGYPMLNIIIDGAWVDENPMARIEAAEVYLAAGTNAPCRVVLTNSPVWTKGGKSALCPLLTHASDEVTFRAGLGELNPATDTIYAYYIGPDGVPAFPFGKRVN